MTPSIHLNNCAPHSWLSVWPNAYSHTMRHMQAITVLVGSTVWSAALWWTVSEWVSECVWSPHCGPYQNPVRIQIRSLDIYCPNGIDLSFLHCSYCEVFCTEIHTTRLRTMKFIKKSFDYSSSGGDRVCVLGGPTRTSEDGVWKWLSFGKYYYKR